MSELKKNMLFEGYFVKIGLVFAKLGLSEDGNEIIFIPDVRS